MIRYRWILSYDTLSSVTDIRQNHHVTYMFQRYTCQKDKLHPDIWMTHFHIEPGISSVTRNIFTVYTYSQGGYIDAKYTLICIKLLALCSATEGHTQQTQSICITFVQRRPNVQDVGPTLYKCYTNVLRLLDRQRPDIQIMLK